MFGDNKSVVTNIIYLSTRLHKRHHILSFHSVREDIVEGIIYFIFISGNNNPTDIQSKAWGYQQVSSMIMEILFWGVDTINVP